MMYIMKVVLNGDVYSKHLAMSMSESRVRTHGDLRVQELKRQFPAWKSSYSIEQIGDGDELVSNDPVLKEVDTIISL